MRRPKQIITALSLLIIMGIPGILFVYYQARQAYIRHEMEEKLEYQHLETLRLPASKVVWYEEGKEIIVETKPSGTPFWHWTVRRTPFIMKTLSSAMAMPTLCASAVSMVD